MTFHALRIRQGRKSTYAMLVNCALQLRVKKPRGSGRYLMTRYFIFYGTCILFSYLNLLLKLTNRSTSLV